MGEYPHNCANCRHCSCHGDQEPCKSCIAREDAGQPPFNRWEAKELTQQQPA